MPELIYWLDLVGVAVFAASGALVASRKQMDLIGFALMASLTGVGGGTLRDLLLDRPVVWLNDGLYLGVCTGVAVLIFFTAHVIQRRYIALLWADGFGIAAYGVMGTELSRLAGVHPLIAIVLGVMTATFGGLLRDTICNETPLVLRKEVYATAAMVAGAVHILLMSFGLSLELSATAGFLAGLAVRACGIHFGLSLPVYKAREGRDYPI